MSLPDHLDVRPEPYRQGGQPDHAGRVAGKSNELGLVEILGNIPEWMLIKLYKSHSWNDIWNPESANIAAVLREIVQLKYIEITLNCHCLNDRSFPLCVYSITWSFTNYLKLFRRNCKMHLEHVKIIKKMLRSWMRKCWDCL